MQEVQITSVTLNQVPLTTNDYYIVNNSNEQISADASITLTIAGKGNYTGTATTTWKITRATPALDNFDVTPDLSQKQTYDGKPKEVTAQPKNGVIGMGAVTVCYEGSNGTTYPRSKTAPTNAGTYQVILSVAEGKNYTAAEIEAGTLTIEKADLTVEDVTEFFEYTKKGEQTINLAELVPGARSYTPDAYTNDNGIVSGDITIDATGLMKFALSELTKDNIDKKVTVPVIITSENYKDVTVKVTIYISPEYRIIDGANSSWTQNTDGTVVIRGNGEFSRFHAVKVDGKVIDPANYEAKEGSGSGCGIPKSGRERCPPPIVSLLFQCITLLVYGFCNGFSTVIATLSENGKFSRAARTLYRGASGRPKREIETKSPIVRERPGLCILC